MDGMNTTVDVAQIAALPVVRQAAQAGEELVGLWPLTGVAHMSNDAKYAENLQVRLSRTLATIHCDSIGIHLMCEDIGYVAVS